MRRVWTLAWTVLASCSVAPDMERDAVVSPAAADVPEACKVADPAALMSCIQHDRLLKDLRFVAAPRPPGSTHWQRVQVHCARTLEQHGYEVEQQRYGTGVNVIGTKLGVTRPQERVVLGAHYDHIAGCPGADDNASGVAGALEIARTLSAVSFDRTLVVACWDEEERGMVGSRAWARRAAARAQNVVVYYNFDAIGFARSEPNTQKIPDGFAILFPEEVERLRQRQSRADFIVAVADERAVDASDALARHADLVGLPIAVLEIPTLLRLTPLAIDLHRSDHASFWDAGFPAVMITDTANYRSGRYHCRDGIDDAPSVDASFLGRVVEATTAAVSISLMDSEATTPRPGGSSQPTQL